MVILDQAQTLVLNTYWLFVDFTWIYMEMQGERKYKWGVILWTRYEFALLSRLNWWNLFYIWGGLLLACCAVCPTIEGLEILDTSWKFDLFFLVPAEDPHYGSWTVCCTSLNRRRKMAPLIKIAQHCWGFYQFYCHHDAWCLFQFS